MYYACSATSEQALAALYLGKIAREIKRTDMAEFFEAQHAELGKIVNDHFWDAKHHIYNDLTEDMHFITELKPGIFCKHCHMFWPMLAEVAPPDRVAGMVAELSNPKSFFRANGVPSLSADSAGYRGGPDGDGTYWRGSVWPPIQCMVDEGLRAVGEQELARQFAVKYTNAVVDAYTKQKDITEFLAPDRPQGHGVGEFVGWGGIGPVADLIEYQLGFEVDAPSRRVTWRIGLLEKHGIKNLSFRNVSADFVCEGRTSVGDPCLITVTSNGAFTLEVETSHGKVEKRVSKSLHQFEVR
jgi:glycogen debranching enzyme